MSVNKIKINLNLFDMKQILIIFILLLIYEDTLKSQSCKGLPNKFNSYREASRAVKNATFKFTDKLPYGKSSWIASAFYYSCDGETGYLIFSTYDGREYIHEKVPINVWIEFKNASSSGSYYNKYIKYRYQLVIE
jgi:hypothetical protein